jgi:NitT/TauT family transport system ATP-binding protein
MTLVTVRNINKSFAAADHAAIHVLDNISMSVEPGDIVCILGPSGCGKTTLLNIIAGIELQSSGTVVVDRVGQVGYVPQKDLLLPWRTVLQNITLGLEVSNTVSTEYIELIWKTTRRYGIEKFLDVYPDVLSGGMRQLISFIRTLIIAPTIFLFDEPFSSIDYELRLRLEDEVMRLIRHTAKGAVFVTHNIEEAIAVGNRIIVLSKRPARVLKEFKIEPAKQWSSVTEARLAPEFQEYFAQIWALFNYYA